MQVLFVEFYTRGAVTQFLFHRHNSAVPTQYYLHKQDMYSVVTAVLRCASETGIGWQRRRVWSYITKIWKVEYDRKIGICLLNVKFFSSMSNCLIFTQKNQNNNNYLLFAKRSNFLRAPKVWIPISRKSCSVNVAKVWRSTSCLTNKSVYFARPFKNNGLVK